MAYSADLRHKALNYYGQCKNISQTAATFNLSRNTLYLWIRLKKQTGSLKHQVTGLNAVKLDRQKLAQYVGQHPDAYLHEIAKHFDCTPAAARSLRGQIVKAQINGKRYRRLSLVSAQVGNRLIAPMVYQNTMTGVFFEAWFQQCLLPALTQKSVIILDNARFHRMGVLREMAEKWGHKVLPLAPYSPELNPIEKVWANIKRYLRTVLSDYARFDDALMSYFYFN